MFLILQESESFYFNSHVNLNQQSQLLERDEWIIHHFTEMQKLLSILSLVGVSRERCSALIGPAPGWAEPEEPRGFPSRTCAPRWICPPVEAHLHHLVPHRWRTFTLIHAVFVFRLMIIDYPGTIWILDFISLF